MLQLLGFNQVSRGEQFPVGSPIPERGGDGECYFFSAGEFLGDRGIFPRRGRGRGGVPPPPPRPVAIPSIGAIDGTHVDVVVPEEYQGQYRGRKEKSTQNVMAACSFDMQFTFALAGWEGTTHDTRIFLDALDSPRLNFPKPPPGKYYLVDAGYPDVDGYLGPYKNTRYHVPDYRDGPPPRGKKEVFNRGHSSLRCCIERSFGVWKSRWQILEKIPAYPVKKQVKIIIATMALHNFIRREALNDPDYFDWYDAHPDYIPTNLTGEERILHTHIQDRGASSNTNMTILREEIARSLMG